MKLKLVKKLVYKRFTKDLPEQSGNSKKTSAFYTLLGEAWRSGKGHVVVNSDWRATKINSRTLDIRRISSGERWIAVFAPYKGTTLVTRVVYRKLGNNE